MTAKDLYPHVSQPTGAVETWRFKCKHMGTVYDAEARNWFDARAIACVAIGCEPRAAELVGTVAELMGRMGE